jgi:uncharacterized coiled-coil DUF342 family protein
MPDDDELDRRVRRLTVEHLETRWLALRLDDDVKEMRQDIRAIRTTQGEHSEVLTEHTARFDTIDGQLREHSEVLTEHTARFDSIDGQLRSLTQLVGEALQRLPGESDGGEPSGR